jgi:RNA polymerase sigma factor (sigma-70 family)
LVMGHCVQNQIAGVLLKGGAEGFDSFSAFGPEEDVPGSGSGSLKRSLRVAGKRGKSYTVGGTPKNAGQSTSVLRPLGLIAGSKRRHVMDDIDALMERAGVFAAKGTQARRAGEESAAESAFRKALDLALDAARLANGQKPEPTRLEILQTTALLALEFGSVADARRLILEAAGVNPSAMDGGDWPRLRDISEWPDEWLVAAVRCEPPDEAALDTLVERYWKPLFARCQMLTLNQEKAKDLAQEAWHRVLRSRHQLKPGRNFSGYLTTIATNLWRDAHRSATRAGQMADSRMESLDAARGGDEESHATLSDVLPDLNALRGDAQKLVAMDIDRALERLSPLLRDVIVSRFLIGETCAAIGQRYRRTEQTASGWVRQALREMKEYLADSTPAPATGNES